MEPLLDSIGSLKSPESAIANSKQLEQAAYANHWIPSVNDISVVKNSHRKWSPGTPANTHAVVLGSTLCDNVGHSRVKFQPPSPG